MDKAKELMQLKIPQKNLKAKTKVNHNPLKKLTS